MNDYVEEVVRERDKRVRNLDKDDLREHVIQLFKIKDRYTLKEVNADLNQPESYVKEVLSEICDVVDATVGRGKEYVLKREFQNYSK